MDLFIILLMTFQLQQKTKAECQCLSLSTDPDGRLLHVLHGFLCLLGFLVNCSRGLLSSGLLLGVLGSSHCLLPLSLPDLGLLVPLGHDVLESCANHGSLELLGPLVPSLGDILLGPLLVLPAVEDSPGSLTRVPLEDMSLVGPAAQEPARLNYETAHQVSALLVALAVHLDEGSPVARVDLVARIHAQVNLHGDFVFCNTDG